MSGERTAEPATGRQDRGPGGGLRSWWLAGITFVVGLFLGAIALGLLHESPPPALVATDPPAAAPADDVPSEAPGANAEITVNEACLRVVNETRDVIDAIRRLGESAADLDIAGVDQSIRALQPLETRLREDLADCEADTTLPGDIEPLPSTTPSPTTSSPTTSSTPD